MSYPNEFTLRFRNYGYDRQWYFLETAVKGGAPEGTARAKLGLAMAQSGVLQTPFV
jgi:hypothetical protein